MLLGVAGGFVFRPQPTDLFSALWSPGLGD